MYGDLDVKELIGKTMVSVENHNNEEIEFVTTEGKKYRLYHESD